MVEFLAMGGYAVFVWGSYGVAALLLTVEVVMLVRRRRTILQRLGRMRKANIGAGHEAQT